MATLIIVLEYHLDILESRPSIFSRLESEAEIWYDLPMSERMTLIKKKKHKRKHGFMNRNKSVLGKKTIKRRRLKKRKKV